MQPRFVHRPQFTVVGMKCRTSMSNNLIPRLWDDFMQRHDEIRDWIEPDNCFGICFQEESNGNPDKDFFSYLAGIEVQNTNFIPEGMEAKTLPAAEYAVFEHIGALDILQETYARIYREWLPQSGYQMTGDTDFELYDRRFKHGQPDSVMEIWIPVVRI
jgi:AraC family transcriptional regulator